MATQNTVPEEVGKLFYLKDGPRYKLDKWGWTNQKSYAGKFTKENAERKREEAYKTSGTLLEIIPIDVEE